MNNHSCRGVAAHATPCCAIPSGGVSGFGIFKGEAGFFSLSFRHSWDAGEVALGACSIGGAVSTYGLLRNFNNLI